jgi:hypothetical protein
MPNLTPEQRSLRARIAVLESWGNTTDRAARTRKAREASPQSLAYWERQVDPEGALPELERRLRAEAKFRAHMTRLSYKRSLKATAAKRSKATNDSRNATEGAPVERPTPDRSHANRSDRDGS